MKNTTIKISFENDFLERIDEAAVKESRSRSELIREATRMYLDRKHNKDSLNLFMKEHVEKFMLSEKDVQTEIENYRQEKNFK
jgi:CopG family transcriptional regulator/antitoxin EndoAI